MYSNKKMIYQFDFRVQNEVIRMFHDIEFFFKKYIEKGIKRILFASI